MGYLPLDDLGGTIFFPLVSARYERGSIILTSNKSYGEWGSIFGDPIIATAILDRLLHHSTTVNIRGESYRLKERRKAGLIPQPEQQQPESLAGAPNSRGKRNHRIGNFQPELIVLQDRETNTRLKGDTMKQHLSALSVLALSMMGVLAPSMKADEWDKKTYITIDRSIEVERAVLPAGSYVLKLVDLPSDRHLVRIMNAEETRVIATVSTVPILRLVAADDSEFRFRSFETGRPPALRAWFYPGDPVGFEFKLSDRMPVESAKREGTAATNVSSH